MQNANRGEGAEARGYPKGSDDSQPSFGKSEHECTLRTDVFRTEPGAELRRNGDGKKEGKRKKNIKNRG